MYTNWHTCTLIDIRLYTNWHTCTLIDIHLYTNWHTCTLIPHTSFSNRIYTRFKAASGYVRCNRKEGSSRGPFKTMLITVSCFSYAVIYRQLDCKSLLIFFFQRFAAYFHPPFRRSNIHFHMNLSYKVLYDINTVWHTHSITYTQYDIHTVWHTQSMTYTQYNIHTV